MIMGHLSKHNYSFMACSHCICDGQRTSCQHTSSYLSRLNEGGGYNDRENDPCVSWKPACHIWNMKVIYSKGQYCNGRRKCYESELNSHLLYAWVERDLYPSSAASRRVTFVCSFFTLLYSYCVSMCLFIIWIIIWIKLCPVCPSIH